ncbi:MAG: YceI family protein [Polyangiaceae bacterium]
MQTESVTSGAQSTAQAEAWAIDASHSSVTFSVRHMMITNVRGEFQKLAGTVKYDAKRPEAAAVEVEIDVASIQTREEKRDAHLRSADFFDVEKFPTIKFSAAGITGATKDGFELTGDLTIHGVTRKVTLEVEGPTAPSKDPWGNTRIGATATTKIKRSDFGMTWNNVLEAGGVLVGDEIKVSLDVSLVKQ